MFLEAKIAFAQTFSNFASNSPVAASIVTRIINAIVIPLVQGLFVLAGLVFIWGVFKLITHADDSAKRKEGQTHILWGVIGMFIMISAYGIIRLIGSTVGVENPFQ